MTIRILAFALLASVISSPVIAQGGGSSSAGGAAGAAPGSAPSGTAGVSPSTSNPSVGTAGVPGPTNGAGLPGGPGPGNNTPTPNQPAANPSSDAAGRPGSDTGIGSETVLPSGQGGGSPANVKSPANAKSTEMEGTSAAAAEFHPEAVIDKSLDQASADITAMSSVELRRLFTLFDQCTFKQRPRNAQENAPLQTSDKRASSAKIAPWIVPLPSLIELFGFNVCFARPRPGQQNMKITSIIACAARPGSHWLRQIKPPRPV
jgi:hypothetical protein